MRWLISSQSLALMASSVTFPFYLLFIKNLGSSYSSFGFAYGIFILSSSVFHVPIGRASDHFGNKSLLIVYSWGMAAVFLFIPLVSTSSQVYMIQIVLGFLGALQKTAEKGMVADMSDGSQRGRAIGKYHFWTSIFSVSAVFASGIIIDFFTISALFYLASLFYAGSGLLILKVQKF
ncbi:MFS transporter [Peribacillus deserti]|uniref:MFS transporter n=1 Tax=Peribacillus deserti TaxID=673318 RepID=A0A2N5M0N8_9BACI|nr:MFS transporter [Peribacillus deserti]PLT27927.1 MFS transporter [Peribacillus deserti]